MFIGDFFGKRKLFGKLGVIGDYAAVLSVIVGLYLAWTIQQDTIMRAFDTYGDFGTFIDFIGSVFMAILMPFVVFECGFMIIAVIVGILCILLDCAILAYNLAVRILRIVTKKTNKKIDELSFIYFNNGAIFYKQNDGSVVVRKRDGRRKFSNMDRALKNMINC